MRKQYYFRPSPNGYYAWDVDRLVELSKNLDVQKISLDSIKEIDEKHWFTNNTEPTCREIYEHARLIQEADLKYPIILSENGRIMDGMHRVGKAYLQNRKIIRAVQFKKDPAPDYTDVDPGELPYE